MSENEATTIDWRPAWRLALAQGEREFLAALQAAVEHELRAFKEQQCAAFRHQLVQMKAEFEAQLEAAFKAVEAENATLRCELAAAREQLSRLRPSDQPLH